MAGAESSTLQMIYLSTWPQLGWVIYQAAQPQYSEQNHGGYYVPGMPTHIRALMIELEMMPFDISCYMLPSSCRSRIIVLCNCAVNPFMSDINIDPPTSLRLQVPLNQARGVGRRKPRLWLSSKLWRSYQRNSRSRGMLSASLNCRFPLRV